MNTRVLIAIAAFAAVLAPASAPAQEQQTDPDVSMARPAYDDAGGYSRDEIMREMRVASERARMEQQAALCSDEDALAGRCVVIERLPRCPGPDPRCPDPERLQPAGPPRP